MRNVTYTTTIAFEENIIFSFQYQNCRVTTATEIFKLLGIDFYEERWEDEHGRLIPAPEEVSTFITDKRYNELNNEQLATGEVYNINPGSISWYLVDRKIKPNLGITTLQNFLMQINLDNSDQSGCRWCGYNFRLFHKRASRQMRSNYNFCLRKWLASFYQPTRLIELS